MSNLLDNIYLKKRLCKVWGGQNCPQFCLRGLYTALNVVEEYLQTVVKTDNFFD